MRTRAEIKTEMGHRFDVQTELLLDIRQILANLLLTQPTMAQFSIEHEFAVEYIKVARERGALK